MCCKNDRIKLRVSSVQLLFWNVGFVLPLAMRHYFLMSSPHSLNIRDVLRNKKGEVITFGGTSLENFPPHSEDSDLTVSLSFFFNNDVFPLKCD